MNLLAHKPNRPNTRKPLTQIHKLYLANFLTGLVFWYGIEKLFMKSIGLDEAAIGTIAAFGLMLNLLFDIPAGMVADKWSRKGMLVISVICLGLASLTMGLSQHFWVYLAGYALYSAYVVTSNGTFQAVLYDLLHEQGRSKQYSKFVGRTFGFFLGGAALGNALGGIIAGSTNLAFPFLISVVPCLLNIGVILSLKEPAFHKSTSSGSVFRSLAGSLRAISNSTLIRTLAIVLTMFWVIEVFKSDFGQLYFMRYITGAELFGLLWAAYAITWAAGGLLAYKFTNRFTLLVASATAPIILLTFVDNWLGIVLFLFQGLTMGALQNQIETTVQHATPSHVRASILSVLSSIGRGVGIPAALFLGWVFKTHGVMSAVHVISFIAALILVFWIVCGLRVIRTPKSYSSQH